MDEWSLKILHSIHFCPKVSVNFAYNEKIQKVFCIVGRPNIVRNYISDNLKVEFYVLICSGFRLLGNPVLDSDLYLVHPAE